MDDIRALFSRNARILIISIVAFFAAATLLMLALFAGELRSLPLADQQVRFRDTISVSGTGEVAVVPDTAEFRFAVVKEGNDIASVQEAVSETMNAMLSFLEAQGIPEENVKTTSYTIAPRYEYRAAGESFPPSGRRVFAGYEVSHWVEVKVEGLEGVGELIGELGNRGATNISSVRFTVEDEETVKADARAKAIANAREKAETLASALGVRLGDVVNFSEGQQPIFREYAAVAEDAVGGGVSAPQIPAGENTFTSNVSITYAIE